MNQRLRQGTSVIAAAFIVAYFGLISVSQVRHFVPWPANLLALSVACAICGLLLALISQRALWLMGMVSVLGALIFSGFWTYSSWVLMSNNIAFLDLVLSDFVFLYVIQRGAVLFVMSAIFGLLGAVMTQILLPNQYLP